MRINGVLDLLNNSLLRARMHPASSAPAGTQGQFYFNTSNLKQYMHDVTHWFSLMEADVEGLPSGTVINWTTNSTPSGYLFCNGAAVSRATYDKLFTAIGTRYGVGNGSTTFNIPDMRGFFMRGWDHGIGRDPDRNSRWNRGDGTTGNYIGTKQTYQHYSHNHTYTSYNNIMYVQSLGGVLWPERTSGTSYSIDSAGSGGNETRPRNVYAQYVIKY